MKPGKEYRTLVLAKKQLQHAPKWANFNSSIRANRHIMS